jgi:hypothetical protein
LKLEVRSWEWEDGRWKYVESRIHKAVFRIEKAEFKNFVYLACHPELVEGLLFFAVKK